MSSSVFYRFRNVKDPTRIEFDGTGISVFELKRDIIIKSGLGDGTDFDLAIVSDDGSNEEYDDDTAIIPRSTTVIAVRKPCAKKGAGRAQRYVNGKMPVSAKNNSRKEVSKAAAKATAATGLAQMNNASMTEEQRLAAMFQAQSEQWNDQLQEMGKQAKVPHSGFHKKSSGDEPPSSYICYRCGQKGHWIKECPTNNDPNWNPVRLKRTTGIPRSFLKTVDKPEILNGDGDDTKLPPGVMVNAEGQFVIAEPDKASWEKFQAKTKSSAAAAQAAALGDKELQDRGLECSLDKRIFIDPMKTPCCEKTYCNDCITNALIESDFTCPGCQTDGVLIDDLKPDDETSAKITTYLEEKNAAARKEKERSKSPSVKAESPASAEKVEKAKSASPAPKSPATQVKDSVKSPAKSPATSVSTPNPEKTPVKDEAKPQSKKRPADELLENPKVPKAPKAMQQQEAQKQAMLQQQQMMNGMNGMGGFPQMGFNMPNMPPMLNNFHGANSGFPGMPNMMNGYGMNMPNPMMMNPMMGMNGGFGGFPNMYGAGFNGMGNMGMMNGGNMGVQNGNGNGNVNGGATNQFPNQQKTVFAEPLPNEEDNAYFRKPVNPHRHQGRQRRVRPSDYREL
ncbi:DWNN-domain-containing protein [Acephala macrosclerotiorum]|nr:DWNN-domain-containing protein [Acephala macrosclerotiorum]